MRGIDFVVDEAGNRKAVVIDLTVHGKIWREFYSQVQATARENDPAPEESTQAGAGSAELGEPVLAAVLAYKQKLIDCLGSRLRRFLIFGSVVRQQNTPESDIDIFITVEGEVDWVLKSSILQLAYEIDLQYDVILDVAVFSEESIQHSIIGKTPFVESVLTEGISV